VQPADEGISPDGFCPFAIRDDQDAHDGGTFIGGPPRGVLHTTEGPTFASARGAFVANNTWPHFTITNETGTVVAHQHLPITVAARTLEHRPNTIDTNRRNAIQIEIVGAAASSQNFSPAYLAGIARLMRWIENHAGVARLASVTFAAPGHEQRLSDAAWVAYAGWCGHQHVPHNSHDDPGAIDIGTLLHGAPVVAPG
jgi:hypothetical protein